MKKIWIAETWNFCRWSINKIQKKAKLHVYMYKKVLNKFLLLRVSCVQPARVTCLQGRVMSTKVPSPPQENSSSNPRVAVAQMVRLKSLSLFRSSDMLYLYICNPKYIIDENHIALSIYVCRQVLCILMIISKRVNV